MSIKKSYKYSHSSKNCGQNYEFFYKKDNYDSRVWILEKETLEKIYSKYIKKTIINYLDFACGTGRILEIFERKAKNVYGVDVSKEMLKIARSKFTKTKFSNIDLTRNRNHFNFKFNVITAFRFFLNAEPSLKEEALLIINQILEDGGFLIFNIHANTYSSIYFLNRKKTITLSLSEIKKLLKKFDFEIVKIFGIGYLPWEFSNVLSKKLWLLIERFFMNLKILNKFGTGLIILSKKVNK